MKVLVWRSKYGNIIVAARTPEEEGRAWLYLFKKMDDMGYYRDLDGDEVAAYSRAKIGEWEYAMRLLSLRSDYEYEQVTTEEIVEP
jgi:hypothetical protein